ncbi:hypothetical protein ElyMa_000176800 [Elysia marginata]|uniref:Secreted protein n=1 Tax=Elysia marginata TaxID=1093978 RepID=A0AAV4EW83_9GAST|nr:hypothetical protein ElyMa_000176800 [Elysia marginata]
MKNIPLSVVPVLIFSSHCSRRLLSQNLSRAGHFRDFSRSRSKVFQGQVKEVRCCNSQWLDCVACRSAGASLHTVLTGMWKMRTLTSVCVSIFILY